MIDLVVGCQPAAARELAPRRWRSRLELQDLRVAQGDVGHGIAGRRDLVAHQADHRELVPARAQRHFLAERQAGGAINDRFIMAAQDVAPGRKLMGAAGPARLEADEEQAERLAVEFGLHRLVGDRARALHAIDSADQFSRVAGNTRRFGKRPVGAGFDHPDIGVGGAGLPQRVVDQAAIDAGDHDHDAEQQAQSEIGQDEAQKIVLDIPIRQIHRLGPCVIFSAILAARPARSPLGNCATTTALSGTPPAIS